MRMHRIPTDVGELHVADDGSVDGIPVVLRHGIFLSSAIWSGVALGAAARAIAVDGPGHGASGPPPRFSLHDDAAATIQVLDALGVDRAVFVGHSWGGMSLARTAAAHPARTLGLALVNTPLRAASPAGRLRFAAIRALIRSVGPVPWVARRIAHSLLASSSIGSRPSLVDEVVDGLRGQDGMALARAVDAVLLTHDDTMPLLPGVRIPTLVVAGEEDYVLPEVVERDLRQLAPSAVIERVRGGHISPLEAPGEVSAFLSAWIHSSAVAGAGR